MTQAQRVDDEAVSSGSLGLPVAGEQRLAAVALLLLVALAVGLRLVPVVIAPSIDWADEIYQSIEQAHRLVHGYGLVPWEFQVGMRSWLLPGTVGGLMEFSRLFGDGPAYYLPVIAIGFGLLASAPVVCCFLWCNRFFGLPGAIVGGAALAIAPELVYFGARTLTEVMTAHLLVVALYLAEPGYPVRSRARLFFAGFLAGMVCLLRFLLAPAVAVMFVRTVQGGWSARGRPLLLGGVAALLALAALDWATLGYPLASVVRNVFYNAVKGGGTNFGSSPWDFYFTNEFAVWLTATPLVVLLVGLGARRLDLPLLGVIAIVAVHTGIPHKEYRFVYPAVLLAMLLAAVGLAQLTHWGAAWLARRGTGARTASGICAVLLLGGWAAVSYGVWTGDPLAELRRRDSDNLAAVSFARQLPALCGVGLYGGQSWDRFGGYSHLHRRVPMFWPDDAAELRAKAPYLDVLLYRAAPPPELGFAPLECFGATCVARRPGECRKSGDAGLPDKG